MSWVIIAGGLLFIFGSFMMLKPSPRDARLAKLRFDAVKAGLKISQFKWEPESKKTGVYQPINTTSYSLTRSGSEGPGALLFSVVFQKGWETEFLPEGYAWHKTGTQEQAEQLISLLPQLQDQLEVLEVWENKIMLMPKENATASVVAYKTFMEAFF